MADPEHLEILKQGVEVWNDWRGKRPNITPDLTGGVFFRSNLSGVNFSASNLAEANLTYANLAGANFQRASLTGTDLFRARLDRANFETAGLAGAKLWHGSLEGANFSRSDLSRANLRNTVLDDADFSGSQLIRADFSEAVFNNTDLSYAWMGGTVLVQNDLSGAKGLETVSHAGPSELSVSTLLLSGWRLSTAFLRGCGVPEELITYLPSLLKTPVQFYSCFISYSSRNQTFADKLYADLQNKGVRCWVASEDLKIGEKVRIGIDKSIRIHDKLLLVLSKHSVTSDWVEQEVETALDRERKEKRTVLFPIRLDDAIMKVESGWPALVRNTRNIGDFRKWKNHDSYQKAFDRLLRDLKAEE